MDYTMNEGQEAEQNQTGDGETVTYENIFIQLRKFYIRLQSECEVPLAELATMLSLTQITREKGYAYPTELKKDMSLSSPAVSRTIATLEKKGYLTRKTGVSDHRNIKIEITEKGRSVIQVEKDRLHSLFGKVREMMGQEDMRRFLHYMMEFFSCMSETE